MVALSLPVGCAVDPPSSADGGEAVERVESIGDPAACGPQSCSGCCLAGLCQSAFTACKGTDCLKCVSCNPGNCNGCCENGVCRTASTTQACGAAGAVCLRCDDESECEAGACRRRTHAPCDASKGCVQGAVCTDPEDGFCRVPCGPESPCSSEDDVCWHLRGVEHFCMPSPRPDDLYVIQIERLRIPPRKTASDGPWDEDGSPPDIFACLTAGTTTACTSEVESRELGWPGPLAAKYRFEDLAALRLNVFDADPESGFEGCVGPDCATEVLPPHDALSFQPSAVNVTGPLLVESISGVFGFGFSPLDDVEYCVIRIDPVPR